MSRNNNRFRLNGFKKISILLFITLMFLIQISPINNINPDPKESINNNQLSFLNEKLTLASAAPILFQGTEKPLNITEYGKLYNNSQEISITNENEINLTYKLDDINNWKVSKIDNSVKNIRDTKNWVNNSDFLPITIFNKSVIIQRSYTVPAGWKAPDIISQSGAYAIRVHFDYINLQDSYDYIRIKNNETPAEIRYVDTGIKNNFYSPWIKGDELYIDVYNDAVGSCGFRIDNYEFVNSSSNYFINNEDWGFNEDTLDGSEYGAGYASNVSAIYLTLFSSIYEDLDENYYSHYEKYNFTELYQNLTIPRGNIINAYISFDYYPEYCMETNNLYIYISINNKKIYSIYFGDIFNYGRNQWHSTGKIYMPIWSNASYIFQGNLNDQKLNISIGIKSASGGYYSGFEDAYQQMVWFDNITLGITALANSTQSGIDLKIDGKNVDVGDQWGKGSQILNSKIWEDNPVILTVNTTAAELYFEMDTTLYGFHNTTTVYNRDYDDGISYEILENGTVYWEFLHDFIKIDDYSDFEFTIFKPINWKILSAKQGDYFRPFEGGEIGDNYLRINKTYAFGGWWTFRATSPNFLNITNTKLYKDGNWVQTSFKTGETTKIKTQVNFSNEIPPNVDLTYVYLAIYHPNGSIFFEDSNLTDENGEVVFSDITFGSFNTTGGYYNYTLFWSNGTTLGGLTSSFLVIHNCSLSLIRPFDAVNDFSTDGFVGDLFPLLVYLKDSENGQEIPNATISYNWTGGQTLFLDSASKGLYEDTIDTEGLSIGIYKIIIKSSKIGFFNANITLEINLGEETNLYILKSQYFIELHANSSIELNYTDSDGDPINGATVQVNIFDQSLYSINNPGNGKYIIEFNTSYIHVLGIYQLKINFSAGEYEPQDYIHQFQIIQQSINLTVLINSKQINENTILEKSFNDLIVVSTKAMAKNDKVYLNDGNFTWLSEDFVHNITETANSWYNTSFLCSPASFSLGYNYVIIKFEKDGYTITTFPFQMIVNQIPIHIEPIDFDDKIDILIGEDTKIEIKLKDPSTNTNIDGASISYSWDYGLGSLDSKGDGIYELDLEVPDDIEKGSYKIKLIISAGEAYRTTEYTIILDVSEEEQEELNWIFWTVITILSVVVGLLSILSYRSYVYLPKKRKREAELLVKTQRFKDMMNIQAIVIIHKHSGIPVFLKSYSILESEKKELFSGFIQAITSIGEEISGKKALIIDESSKKDRNVIELDFKHFYCLISDTGNVRVIFILKEKASNRLKSIIIALASELFSEHKTLFEEWDGELAKFERNLPPIINKHVELYYKEDFKLAKPQAFAEIKKETELTSMELRVINVIRSFAKNKSEFILSTIPEMVFESNKDLVIEAIESLIKRKLIIPV